MKRSFRYLLFAVLSTANKKLNSLRPLRLERAQRAGGENKKEESSIVS